MTLPSFDTAQFRQNFPEFSDIARYPDAQITFWSDLAIHQVDINRWKGMWLKGVSLYTAHEIALAAKNQQTAAFGGVPGTGQGLTNNKAVGQTSVGYDTVTASEKNAGWWNLTIYGQQFFRLSRMVGMGAIQL